MGTLEAILDVTMFEAQSQFGSSTAYDEILFHFIGLMLGPFQLCGPLNLHGWNLILVILSTTLVVGYLLIVGRHCQIGSRSHTATDYVKFILAVLPCFLPPFIRLGIRIAQTTIGIEIVRRQDRIADQLERHNAERRHQAFRFLISSCPFVVVPHSCRRLLMSTTGDRGEQTDEREAE